MKRFLPLLLLGIATAALPAAPPASDDGHRWMVSHRKIMAGDHVVAEYTYIHTVDEVSPALSRLLYRTDAGVAILIRMADAFVKKGGIVSVTSIHAEITKLDTGDTLTIDIDSERRGTATIAGKSVAFVDSDTFEASSRQAGLRLFEGAPPAFQKALRNVLVVGTSHDYRLDGIAFAGRQLFCPDIVPPAEDEALFDTIGSDPMKPFDPQKNPPGAFELPFGEAYFR